jgi:putative RecB family exonuclease
VRRSLAPRSRATELSDRPPTVAAMSSPAAPTDAQAPVRGSLSPSRAGDFMTCPLRYRFRVLDRLPEPASAAAARGVVVHTVLEQLFELDPRLRTVGHAISLLEPAWTRLELCDPALTGLFDSVEERDAWLGSAGELITAYFRLEDPSRLRPAARELLLEYALDDGPVLRGILDRLDEAPTGDLRVVDYKTGRSPALEHERAALFQLKFYALLLWRTRGRIPRELRFYYLGDEITMVYRPEGHELLGFERTIRALWAAIERSSTSGVWRARPSRLCEWCNHQAICPAWGGTPPPLPTPRRQCGAQEMTQTREVPSAQPALARPEPQDPAADGPRPDSLASAGGMTSPACVTPCEEQELL